MLCVLPTQLMAPHRQSKQSPGAALDRSGLSSTGIPHICMDLCLLSLHCKRISCQQFPLHEHSLFWVENRLPCSSFSFLFT